MARKTQRLLKRLPTLLGEKRLSSEDAGSILLAVWEEVDEEGELEKLEIPGISQALNLDLLLEYDFPWTVSSGQGGHLRHSQAAGETPETLLQSATEEARLKVIRARSRAEEVERDLRDMSRERLLPDEMTCRRSRATKLTSPEGCIKRCTSRRLCKRSEAVAPLLWPASTCRASKAKTAKRTSPSRLAVDSGLQGY